MRELTNMIITFCGHAQFSKSEKYQRTVLDFLKRTVGDQAADMYLGGYGNFDSFAYGCCLKYKESHPNISLVFITPYVTPEYMKNRFECQSTKYDSVIYPEIEDKPLKFAITYRNRWMVEKADYVVCFITHSYGGAYKTYQHAKKCNKKIINIFNDA